MKVIGLTGGIGSGKSAIAGFLKEMGAAVIDADKVGHEILNPGTAGCQKVSDEFGKSICTPEGGIDRKRLSWIVFNDPESLKKLNAITHPLILDEVKRRIKKHQAEGYDVVIVEAALILESGWSPYMDEIWLALAPQDITLARLEKRGLSPTEARARISAQIPGESKIKQAAEVIENSGSLPDLRSKVAKLWNRIHNDK
jgi:dephospho-CoA kinase